MAGTGLPLPQSNGVLVRPSAASMPAMDRNTADVWNQVARIGEQMVNAGVDEAQMAARQQRIGNLADLQVEGREFATTTRQKFENDPAGYKAAMDGWREGKLGNMDPEYVPAMKQFYSTQIDSDFTQLSAKKQGEDTRLAANSIEARRAMADSDVMALATAGRIGTPEWETAVKTHSGVMDAAVSSKLISPEQAELSRASLTGRAQAEVAGIDGRRIASEQGLDAAAEHLRTSILENTDLKMSSGDRYKAYNRGLQEARLVIAEQKQDRALHVEASKDLRKRLESNQPVDDGEIASTLGSLKKSGAVAEFNQLATVAATRQATEQARSGAMTIPEMSAQVQDLRGERARPPVASGGRARADAVNRRAASAMSHFMARGLTQAQAAGVVGNLMQESALRTGARNKGDGADGSDSIGLAQWNGNRATALKSFAAARKKPVDDFETQLDFVLHELETTEGGVGAALKGAKTAEEAASIFIGYERPQGWSEGNPRGGHGWNNRAMHAARLAGEKHVPGAVVAGVQKAYTEIAKDAWPEFKIQIEKDPSLVSPENLQAMGYMAKVSGDVDWQREVDAYMQRYDLSQEALAAPEAAGSAAVDQARAEISAGGNVDPIQTQVLQGLESELDRQRKLAQDDPIRLAQEMAQAANREVVAPPPLDLTSIEATQASVASRVSMARSVAVAKESEVGSPLGPAERRTIQAAVSSGDPTRVNNALAAVTAVPDDFLLQTLEKPEIKGAIIGAALSTDPVKFGAAMVTVEDLWRRIPNEAERVLGEGVIKKLQDWQGKLRYYTPDEMAKQLQANNDPQTRARVQTLEAEGRRVAAKKTPDDLMNALDDGWLSAEPTAPSDPGVRNRLMGDYENLLAERFGALGDEGTAHEQAIARMKKKWAPSTFSNDELMLHPPEKYYGTVNESHDWMKTQIEKDLESRLGPRVSENPEAFGGGNATPNWNYRVLPDERTDADLAAGRPPRYLIQVQDMNTGRFNLLMGEDAKPVRYGWDIKQVPQPDFAEMQRRRSRRYGGPTPDIAPGLNFGSPF